MTEHPGPAKGRPAKRAAALFASCPRCGEATLFAGPIRFADKCAACGLDYSRFNVGDGPAAFITMVVGAIVLGLMVFVLVTINPPWWVHMLLWMPLTVALVVLGLRMAKAWLLGAEYRRDAGEHRHDGSELS